jgi:5-methylcytosine-specific restriction endonuclease McrA
VVQTVEQRQLMRSALVLNATYEPLSVVSARRAICLVLCDKAEVVVEETDSMIHSERLSFASPLVIRLRYVVKVPYHRNTTMSRRAVFARDHHRCGYCGGAADSIDHVMPRSRGGKNVWENVIAACRGCNLRKRDRTPEEAGMKLSSIPHAPREMSWIMYAVPRVPEQWKPYLAEAS